MRYHAATCRKSSVDTQTVYNGDFAIVAFYVMRCVQVSPARGCIVSTETARAGVSTCKIYNSSITSHCVHTETWCSRGAKCTFGLNMT